MNIRYIKNKDINKEKWDRCISSSANGLIYAYSGYLDIAAENWDGLIYDDYSVVMPLIWKKKFCIKYIYQPLFTQQSGIFSSSETDAYPVEAFIRSIPRKFKSISINLNSKNKSDSLKLSQKNNYELDLNKPYKELSACYVKNTIKTIRKAESYDLKVLNDLKPEDLIRMKNETLNVDIPKDALQRLERLIRYYQKENCAKIYGVYDKGILLSTALFLYSHNRAYYLSASSNSEGRKKKSSYLLMDSFIRDHADKDLILDFEGSNIPGIARYFEGWGAEKKHYYQYKIIKSQVIKRLKKIRKDETI